MKNAVPLFPCARACEKDSVSIIEPRGGISRP